MLIAGTTIVAVGLAYAMFSGLSRLLQAPATPDPVTAEATPATPRPAAPAVAVPKIKATLFFASEDGLQLTAVEREVPLAVGAVPQARARLMLNHQPWTIRSFARR